MNSPLKNILRPLMKMLPRSVQDQKRQKWLENEYLPWEQQGKPIPPPHIVKQLAIKEIKEKNQIDTLVETGTYIGDMIYAQLPNFSKIYSIELSEYYYKRAQKRFKKNKQVDLLKGDSSDVLKEIIPLLNRRTIFWLDGHYSGGYTAQGEKDCPIFEELSAIFESELNHILLIDDARCFINGDKDYPSPDELKEFILKHRPNSTMEIKDDIIRIELLP